MPDAGATGRRVARAQRQVLPTVDTETRHGVVTAVVYESGRAKLSIDIEGQGGPIPGIFALGHYLGPKIDDHVLVVGSEANWTCLGTVTAAGAPVTKIGARRVAQSVPTSSNTVGAFTGGDVGLDTHGWADPANNRVVPDIEGWYLVAGYASAQTSLIAGERFVYLGRVGGFAIGGQDNVQGGASSIDASFAEVVYCDGTFADAIDVLFFQTDASGNLSVQWSYSVTLLRPGLA